MSKDIRWEPLPEMHGKVRGKSKVYFGHRRDTGTCYSAGVPAKRTHFTAEELAKQAKFRETAALVQRVFNDPDTLSNYVYDFRHQTKYKTIRGYIFARLYAEGNPFPAQP